MSLASFGAPRRNGPPQRAVVRGARARAALAPAPTVSVRGSRSPQISATLVANRETRVDMLIADAPRRSRTRTPSITSPPSPRPSGSRARRPSAAARRVSRSRGGRLVATQLPSRSATRARGRAVRARCWTTPRSICAATTRSRPPRTRVSGRCFDARARGGATRLARGAGGRVARGVQGRVRRARGVRARGCPRAPCASPRGCSGAAGASARAPRRPTYPAASAGNAVYEEGSRPASARWCTAGTRGRGGGQGEVRARRDGRRRRRSLDARLAGTNFPARSAGERTRQADAPVTEPEETLDFDPEAFAFFIPEILEINNSVSIPPQVEIIWSAIIFSPDSSSISTISSFRA